MTAFHATLPTQMRCIDITQPGGIEMLKLVQRPLPTLKAGEVLLQVAAAGVNRADTSQRKGTYPVPAGASDILGMEVSGTVVAMAADVKQWQLGDQVCALVTGGGYAEYCAAPADNCMPIPQGISLVDAAALPETFMTVWSNVWDRARLAPGESLLIQGGSSGIGVTAIQMAKALGHKVYTTAGSDEKCAACEQLGADRAINYRNSDFVAEVLKLTDGRGVNVVLDMVAGDYVQREIQCLADDGRLAIIATLGGLSGEVPFSQMMRKRLTITGSTLRPRPVAFKRDIAAKLQQHIWPLLGSGRIKPVIYQRFALADAPAAHALMESSQHIGKILLTC
jgi:NADPH2:quinone reductase